MLNNQASGLDIAVAGLRRGGHEVVRADFPPAPLPGLWLVDGHELTEMQVVWRYQNEIASLHQPLFKETGYP